MRILRGGAELDDLVAGIDAAVTPSAALSCHAWATRPIDHDAVLSVKGTSPLLNFSDRDGELGTWITITE
jgi:hypothetical protein